MDYTVNFKASLDNIVKPGLKINRGLRDIAQW